MKVILCEDIEKLGSAGQVKEVAPGYARNFLLPRDLAMVATASNMKRWESEKKAREVKFSKNLENAKNLAAQLEAVNVQISARAGREGHLFGSVTNIMVAQALAAQGFKVERKCISIENAIKSVGEHSFVVKLHSQVSATVKLNVVAESESEQTLPA